MSATRRTWSDFSWPSWVPGKVRSEIESFWNPDWGRGPDEWLRNTHDVYNAAPEMGTRVVADLACSWPRQQVTGIYVHAWNNIGRLVDDNGVIHVVCCSGWRLAP